MAFINNSNLDGANPFPEGDGPEQKNEELVQAKPEKDFAQICLKMQPRIQSDPEYKLVQDYRDDIGGEIYRRAYQLREEFEMMLDFKAFLDVYDDIEHSVFHHELDVVHLHLTDLADSILGVERQSVAIAVETLEYLSVGKEFEKRHSWQTMDEKRLEFLQQRHPDIYDIKRSGDPEVEHVTPGYSCKSPEDLAAGFLTYITKIGPLLQEKVELLVRALERDLHFIQLGHGSTPVTPENSRTAAVIAEAKELLEPKHLPEMLKQADLALKAINGTIEKERLMKMALSTSSTPGAKGDISFSA